MSKADGGLRSVFSKRLTQFDWQPIETGGISSGVPDANACGGGSEFWVEFKRTDTDKIKFEEFQPQWIWRRYRHGGRVWVAVRKQHDGGPRRGDPVDELWLVYGGAILELVSNGLRLDESLVSGRWRGGPERWDWTRIGELLVGCGG